MDWKSWYRAELESDAGRARIREAIAGLPEGDPDVRAVLRGGGAVSFPHTTLVDSAEPLARVATSIVAEGFARVLALGVLHGSTAPESDRAHFTAAARGDREALARVGGAFMLEGGADTPFGRVGAGPAPGTSPWTRPGDALLANEFSLDLFCAVLAAAAARSERAPPVTRVFIGPTVTSDTDAGDDVAPPVVESVARALRALLGPGVALVATGDLVHAGHGYAPAIEVESLPKDGAALTAHFRARATTMLEGSLAGGLAARAADGVAREIQSDMRHVLSVLATLLGPGARARIVSFRMTEYGAILDRPSPCVVASALVAFERARVER